MEAIRLDTGNDRNGNPRRVFVIIEDGAVIATADEGYTGRAALDALWGSLGGDNPPNYATFVTTPGEYRELVKLGGAA